MLCCFLYICICMFLIGIEFEGVIIVLFYLLVIKNDKVRVLREVFYR